LAINLATQAGRDDWIPVKLIEDGEGLRAEPVFGKSNLIFTLARADGLVRIPPDANGLPAGEPVDVWLM
jgi:molybdopterin molybdotransferase